MSVFRAIKIDIRLHAVIQGIGEVWILSESFEYQVLYPGTFKRLGNLSIGRLDPLTRILLSARFRLARDSTQPGASSRQVSSEAASDERDHTT